ncbi:hypothetical protein [Streptomyces apocyni]|uniref:hypothetical protein n=1 Tax=Streptomyces apocyni TaxID=2654677 RepID=UPI0012EA4E74|nr:hypothetical protein [Streptomyces apocyni]
MAIAVLLATAAVGCGSDSDSDTRTGASASPSGSGSGGQGSASSRIEAVNKTMRETAFTGAGTTTAFEGARQEVWWDPEQGLRMKISGPSEAEGGDLYCKGGTSYTGARLFASMLAQRGQEITVPERLSDVYVSSETGQDCDAYFTISTSGQFAPDKDTTIDGKAALAIEVSAGAAADTYFVSAEGPGCLLRQESERDGRTSRSTYGGFGEAETISMPTPEQTMTMAQFRSEVGAG